MIVIINNNYKLKLIIYNYILTLKYLADYWLSTTPSEFEWYVPLQKKLKNNK